MLRAGCVLNLIKNNQINTNFAVSFARRFANLLSFAILLEKARKAKFGERDRA